MTQAQTKASRKLQPMNGVDTPTLFATLDAVRAQPDLAKFQFRATNRWQQGTHSRTRFESFYGAGGEQKHVKGLHLNLSRQMNAELELLRSCCDERVLTMGR